MFVELITLVAIAFAVSGIVMISFRLIGKKAPKVLIILTAGVSMLGFTIWSRQNWAPNVKKNLPANIEVVHEVPYAGWLEPWTKIWPRSGRLVAIDHCNIQRNPKVPGLRLTDVMVLENNKATVTMRHVLDCSGSKMALVPDDVAFNDDGRPLDLEWVDTANAPYLQDAICGQNAIQNCLEGGK